MGPAGTGTSGALYVGAVEAVAEPLAEGGDHARAIEYARKAVAVEPLREDTHQNLVRLLAACGSVSEALRHYAEMERILAEELGETPSAASQALVEQLRAKRDQPPEIKTEPVPVERPSEATSTSLPDGTITLLLTDMSPGDQGATSQVDAYAAMRAELNRCTGHPVTAYEDIVMMAFERPSDALQCVLSCLRVLQRHPRVQATNFGLRMALDTGEPELSAGTRRGAVVERVRGLLLAGHAGQVLCSEATAGVLRGQLPDGVTLVDHGQLSLRTVPQPQRVFSIACPGARAADELPPNAPSPFAPALPAQFTRFFDRDGELAHLRQLILDERTRLVTLTGPGGSGKTRLVVEAARKLSDAFHGAVWFVPLQELSDPELVGGAVVDALDLQRNSQAYPWEQACEALSGQPSLLVLDNFEQLADSVAALVQTAVERTRTLNCIVTSRQRLDISAEREFWVDPLPTPE